MVSPFGVVGCCLGAVRLALKMAVPVGVNDARAVAGPICGARLLMPTESIEVPKVKGWQTLDESRE